MGDRSLEAMFGESQIIWPKLKMELVNVSGCHFGKFKLRNNMKSIDDQDKGFGTLWWAVSSHCPLIAWAIRGSTEGTRATWKQSYYQSYLH